MWFAVTSSLRAFNTVQGTEGSGTPSLCTKFEQSANVLKKSAFAGGLFRLSGIFNTKRLRSACAHGTYHWPKQFLPWIQMMRFSGDEKPGPLRALLTTVYLSVIYLQLALKAQHHLLSAVIEAV